MGFLTGGGLPWLRQVGRRDATEVGDAPVATCRPPPSRAGTVALPFRGRSPLLLGSLLSSFPHLSRRDPAPNISSHHFLPAFNPPFPSEVLNARLFPFMRGIFGCYGAVMALALTLFSYRRNSFEHVFRI